MIKNIILTTILIYLLCVEGCSSFCLKYTQVDSNIDSKNTSLPLIDLNVGTLKIAKETVNSGFNTKPIIDLDKPCRIKYKSRSSNTNIYNIVITGQLINNYKCDITIDTGCPVLGALTYNIVKDNKLPIFPVDEVFGVCHVPNFQMGDMTISEVYCIYINKRWELQFFGISVKKYRDVIFGLQLIKEYKYIMFDGVHEEVTFSTNQSFIPLHDDQWLQYPIKIEKDQNDNLKLMVDIPIEGKIYHIGLDTGQAEALSINTKYLESMKVTGEIQKYKQLHFTDGLVDCQRLILHQINICNRVINNPLITISPDNMTNFIGMQCFNDTVMVLDFENKIMWVKILQ